MKFGNYTKTNISVNLESGSVMVSVGTTVQCQDLSQGRVESREDSALRPRTRFPESPPPLQFALIKEFL